MANRPKQHEIVARRAHASELRLQGKSLAEIGRALKVSVSQVSKDLKACRKLLREAATQATEELAQDQYAQNSLLAREAWAAWERSKNEKITKAVETSGDKGNKQKTKLRTETKTGNPAYLVIVERALERQNKILGIDGSQASFSEIMRQAAGLADAMDLTVIDGPEVAPSPPTEGNGQPKDRNGNGKS